MKYSDIPPYTRWASYCVDIPLDYLEVHLDRYVNKYGANLDPDFQRPHVWTEEQQIRFVEHILKGGQTGKDILFNCPGWNHGSTTKDFVLVDGKQRLEALRRFLQDEICIFGHKKSEIEGHLRSFMSLKFHVNDLKTRAEVLQWYLDFNTGGTLHTPEEIARVHALLEAEKAKK
jgi:hypothetical protein